MSLLGWVKKGFFFKYSHSYRTAAAAEGLWVIWKVKASFKKLKIKELAKSALKAKQEHKATVKIVS